jgi:hypothetical protein
MYFRHGRRFSVADHLPPVLIGRLLGVDDDGRPAQEQLQDGEPRAPEVGASAGRRAPRGTARPSEPADVGEEGPRVHVLERARRGSAPQRGTGTGRRGAAGHLGLLLRVRGRGEGLLQREHLAPCSPWRGCRSSQSPTPPAPAVVASSQVRGTEQAIRQGARGGWG